MFSSDVVSLAHGFQCPTASVLILDSGVDGKESHLVPQTGVDEVNVRDTVRGLSIKTVGAVPKECSPSVKVSLLSNTDLQIPTLQFPNVLSSIIGVRGSKNDNPLFSHNIENVKRYRKHDYTSKEGGRETITRPVFLTQFTPLLTKGSGVDLGFQTATGCPVSMNGVLRRKKRHKKEKMDLTETSILYLFIV